MQQREPDRRRRTQSTKRRDTNVGQAELVRAALGGEAAVHDRERALGVGAGHRRGQREVGAQPVVAHAVVELGAHTHEALAGAQLEGRAHVDGDASRRCARVHERSSPTACAGHVYVGVDDDAGAHRPGSSVVDRDRLGSVDDAVAVGRRVVVGVAAVAAVDEPAEPGDVDAVGVVIVNVPSAGSTVDAEVLVGEHRAPLGAHRGRRAVALDGAVKCASRSPAPRRRRTSTSRSARRT